MQGLLQQRQGQKKLLGVFADRSPGRPLAAVREAACAGGGVRLGQQQQQQVHIEQCRKLSVPAVLCAAPAACIGGGRSRSVRVLFLAVTTGLAVKTRLIQAV